MNKTLTVLGILAIVAVAVGAFVLNQPKTIETVITKAVSSPDIPSPYVSWGDVRHWAGKTTSLTAASTTICAIQSPAATSTLEFGSIRFSTATSTDITVTLAKAATPYATTTSLGSGVLASGLQGTFVASSSPMLSSPLDPSQVFAPNTYFVVGVAGGIGGVANNAPVGVCQAGFREI